MVVARLHAGNANEAEERPQAEGVLGVASAEPEEQGAAEADRELVHGHAGEAGGDEVPRLVDEHGCAESDGDGDYAAELVHLS